MRPRLWLLAPVVVLTAADAGLTLHGQPASYWVGEYETAVEGNPLARPFLVGSPWLFIAAVTGWLVLVSAVVLTVRHPAVGWAVVILVLRHPCFVGCL